MIFALFGGKMSLISERGGSVVRASSLSVQLASPPALNSENLHHLKEVLKCND